jgi:uncharacterized protein (TIGR00290 family)
MREKVILCFSGGKDSILALYELQRQRNYEVVTLLTTITSDYDRISMHGVNAKLLELQAKSLGLLVEKVPIPKNSTDKQYEFKMREVLEKYQQKGIDCVAFGDIFLEDIRGYRETNLSKIGFKAIFPIWKKDTTKLAESFINLGFKAVITCVDRHIVDKTFVGRTFDEQFLSEIPSNIDPCGENGEFHSFVYDGPIFSKRICHKKGKVVLKNKRFYYCDLEPIEDSTKT